MTTNAAGFDGCHVMQSGRHITWLTLRHTAASLMFDAGFTIFEVQHRRTSAPPLLGTFRSQLQGDLLARVLLGPCEMTISELARALGSPVATVQREVSRLETMGLLTTRRVGRARLVAGNDSNPATEPLRDLVMVAFGPRQVVAEEFADLERADTVIIFGSWAARHAGQPGSAPGDIDVLVVGDPDRADVFDAAERAQARLGRPVNATVVSAKRWTAADEAFLKEVRRRPMITVAETVSARHGTKGNH